MNISQHLLIDNVILSAALTITLVLRAKGNAARKEKENKWLLKKRRNNLKPKGLQAYWNKECANHPSDNHCKIFCD